MTTLADLNNKHGGKECWIFGTGPSLDSIDMDTVTGPRILINRAAFAVPYSDDETYWMVIDNWWEYDVTDTWYKTLDRVKSGCGMIGVFRDNSKIPLFPTGSNVTNKIPSRISENIIIWDCVGKIDNECLYYTREEVASKNKLYPSSGSINSAVHLAWYMVCHKIKLVGVDGTVKITPGHGYANIIACEYGDKSAWLGSYSKRKHNALDAAEALGLIVKDYSIEVT